MLLDPFTRFLVKLEIAVRAHYNHGAPLKLVSDSTELDIFTILKNAVGKPIGEITVQNKDTVRLASVDLLEKKGVLVLLFRRGDPDASAQIYEDDGGSLRRSDKKPHEKVAVSTHLVIKMAPIAKGAKKHSAVLEEIPGLGRSYIQLIISQILREVEYDYLDKNGNTGKTHTLVSVDGVPSQKLTEGGGFMMQEIELVRAPNIDGLDVEGIEPKEVRMKIKIDTHSEKFLDRLKGVANWAYDNDWSRVKVRLKTPEDRTKVVALERGNDAADVMFIYATQVKVKKPMDQCVEKPNMELIAQALKHLGT